MDSLNTLHHSHPHHHHYSPRPTASHTSGSYSATNREMSSDKTLNAAIIIISDTAAHDASTDQSRAVLTAVFQEQTNVDWNIYNTQIIPDQAETIRSTVIELCDSSALTQGGLNLIVTTGGTGFATKDVTPEAIEPLLEKKAPGLV